MIYVSSSCVKSTFINESVEKLAEEGFKNIELSGGTKPYPNLEQDLLALQDKYGLNYLCHNYFPPPEIPFVINIASLDDKIHELSMENISEAIKLSKKLGADRFGFHAGFLLNIPIKEIGKKISKEKLFDRSQAETKFVDSIKKLQSEFSDMELYIENNVLSGANFASFEQENPFFLCSSDSYEYFKEKVDFKLLLDLAHLKVSSETLNLNFNDELDHLIQRSDYIHISDNDAKVDSNGALREGSDMFNKLSGYNLKNKTITLEIYDSIDEIKKSMDLIKSLVK